VAVAAYYFPPGRFEDLKNCQYIHVEVTAAMDVGLGEYLDSAFVGNPRIDTSSRGSPASGFEATSFEIQRYWTLLTCQLLCTGFCSSGFRLGRLPKPAHHRCFLARTRQICWTLRFHGEMVKLACLGRASTLVRRGNKYLQGCSSVDSVDFEDPILWAHLERAV